MNSQDVSANSPGNIFNYHSSYKTKSGQEISLEGRQVSEKGKSQINSYKISLLFDLSRLRDLDTNQQQNLENLYSEKKIIVAEKGILLNTNKIEDVSIFFNVAKNLISEKDSVELQKFINLSKLDIEDQDIDEGMLLNAEKILNENLCEMPPGTPFSDTDLIILKDSYPGAMPQNGISESDFKQMCILYNAIEKNETSIKIDHSEDVPIFLNLIKTLLTRDIGRRLIQKCASQAQAVHIKSGESPEYITYQKSGYSSQKETSDSMHLNTVTLDFSNKYFYHGMKPNGEKAVSHSWPLHVMLAHELIHHLHYSTLIADRLAKPTLESDYHDLAEQRAITGYSREPEISDFISTEKLAEYDELFEKGLDTTGIFQSLEPLGQKKEVYYEFNERAIMNAFTDSKNVFYPRVGHTGVKKTLEEVKQISIENLANNIKALKDGPPLDFLKVVAEANETIFMLPLSVQSIVIHMINELMYAAENSQSKNYQVLQNPECKALLGSLKDFNRQRTAFLSVKENALKVIRNQENRQFLKETDAIDELIEICGHDKDFMLEVSKYGL